MEPTNLNYPNLDSGHSDQFSYPQLDQIEANLEQKEAAKEETKAQV